MMDDTRKAEKLTAQDQQARAGARLGTTDLERLRATFEALGVRYYLPSDGLTIELDEGTGYVGFNVTFVFDANGKFLTHKVME
jgi:hypothetical protein